MNSYAAYDPQCISDYYTIGNMVNGTNCAAVLLDERIKRDVTNGVPCQIAIRGYYNITNNTGVVIGKESSDHQVVVCGWAEYGQDSYACLNFGWGGPCNGFYNISESFDATRQDDITCIYTNCEAWVGHYPRAKPQIDPLPTVCSNNVTVTWHFPDFYTNSLLKFIVKTTRFSNDVTTNFTDFTIAPGSSSDIFMSVREDSVHGVGRSNLLYTTHCVHRGNKYLIDECEYLFDVTYKLTSASVLTFDILSNFANWMTYEVQASFDGGPWQMVCTPPLNEAYEVPSGYWCDAPEWQTCRVFLGDHGGQTARFRILKGFTERRYFNDVDLQKILLDDFTVTDVLAIEQKESNARKKTRFNLTRLSPGSDYSVTVTPVMSWSSSSALVDAEVSDSIFFSVEGDKRIYVAGHETQYTTNFVFSTNDTSGIWSYYGVATNETTISNDRVSSGWNTTEWWKCSVTINVPVPISTNAVLSFDWKSDETNYNLEGEPQEHEGRSWDCYDAIHVFFIDADDSTTYNITYDINRKVMVAPQHVELSLAQFAGRMGSITIACSDIGWVANPVVTISSVSVNGITIHETPAVAFNVQALTALGTPEIRGVTVRGKPIREGMFHECGIGNTEFLVECSDSVTNLEARPSHLSLVRDEDVEVENISTGKFMVRILHTNISVANKNERSRMILTLAATDANGTTAYKDISLRFSQRSDGLKLFLR